MLKVAEQRADLRPRIGNPDAGSDNENNCRERKDANPLTDDFLALALFAVFFEAAAERRARGEAHAAGLPPKTARHKDARLH